MTKEEAKDKELNPHNYKEGRFKYPLNHRQCRKTIYFYKTKPCIGEIPIFENVQRISKEQPVPKHMGSVSCHYCSEEISMMDIIVDEAQEME